MSKINTEDCKLFLLDLYKEKNSSQWKRIKKFKNSGGYVCREFSHSDGTIAILLDKDGQLSIFSDDNHLVTVKEQKSITALTTSLESGLNTSKKVEFTLFSEQQHKAAKRLVNAFIKPKDEPILPESGDKGFEAIPNLIYFSFLEDANCDETEYLETISKDLNYDAPMKDINVFFIPTTVSSCSEHLTPLIESFLTVPLFEIEEMTFRTDEKNMTVSDVFEKLTKSGFVYNPKGCALKSLFMVYERINKDPVIDPLDRTLEYKKGFVSALKKDNVTQLRTLIDDGLPLNLKIGKESLLSYAMYHNKLACFKYLTTIYHNTANVKNGVCDQVWEYVWGGNECAHYLLGSTVYDFRESNKVAHEHLVMALGHNNQYFNEGKNKVNIELFSLSCLELTITYDRFYSVFKEYVQKAIIDYPENVSSSLEIKEDLIHGFIIPPILELLAQSSCTFNGKTVFELVKAKIDQIGNEPQGHIENIKNYKNFLEKFKYC